MIVTMEKIMEKIINSIYYSDGTQLLVSSRNCGIHDASVSAGMNRSG